MEEIFGNLSYIEKQALPIGRPVDDLNALYKKKDEDYTIAKENYYTAETALNSLPYRDKDKAIVDRAKGVYAEAHGAAEAAGNYEDMIPDSRKLAHDLVNKYGLMEVQKMSQAKATAIAEEKKRLDAGEISLGDFQRAVQDEEDNYEGIQYDEITGTYNGKFNMRPILKSYNFAEETAKAVAGMKANKQTITNKAGQKLLYTDQGYFNVATEEYVSEEEVLAAARSFLVNDPRFQDKIADDLYYETKSILYDRNTKERRDMTVDDIQNILGEDVTNKLAVQLGVEDATQLEGALEARNMSPEDLYKQARKQQMMDSASLLGVYKEGFVKQEDSFLQDWMLKQKMADAASTTAVPFGMLTPWADKQNFTAKDTERLSKLYSKTTDDIKAIEKTLNEWKLKEGTSLAAHPNDVQEKQVQLNELKRSRDIMVKRIDKFTIDSPEIRKKITSIVDNDFSLNELMKEKGIYNYDNRYDGLGVEGLSINTGSVNQLLYKMLGNDVTDEELQEYIQLPKNEILAEAYKQNVGFGNWANGSKEEQIYESLKEKGEATFTEFTETNTLKDKVIGAYTSKLNTQTNNFRRKLDKVVTELKTKLDNEDTPYTTRYQMLIPPNMAEKDKRAHPIGQLEYMLAGSIERNAEYYVPLTSATTGLSAAGTLDEIMQDMKVNGNSYNKGYVDWAKGKMTPSTDSEADIATGKYSPTVVLNVPVYDNDGKNPVRLQIGVKNNEPTYIAKYQEAIVSERNRLISTSHTRPLEQSESLLLSELNTTLYNLSPKGQEIDNLDLFNAKHGEVIPFEYWDGHDTHIKVFKYGSAQDMMYYLGTPYKTENNEDAMMYDAFDVNGKHVQVTEEELKEGQYTALGSNTPKGLKELLGNVVFNNISHGQEEMTESSDGQPLVSITGVFGKDIKDGVDARVHPSILQKVQTIKKYYPSLLVTDGFRGKDSEIGAKASLHKDGKALDFRLKDPITGVINQDAVSLSEMPDYELASLGIKSVGIHNNNHVHIEFL